MKTHIVIHHSAGPDGEIVDWQGIRRYHVEHNRWRDIGYHLGIERIGDRFEGLLGRALDSYGAHAGSAEWNMKSVGVVFVGDYSHMRPEWSMLFYGAQHIAGICRLAGIVPGPETILPHRAVRPRPTKCPGDQFPMEILIGMIIDNM